MIRLISLAILVFYVTFCAVSCGPNMPKENPKFRGTGTPSGDGTAPTDTPAPPPAVAPADDTETTPPEDPGTVIPPTPPSQGDEPIDG